jgi:hypothetical protein
VPDIIDTYTTTEGIQMSTSVKVQQLPSCDFCGQTAHYDAATSFGPWANMCDAHFNEYGLGLGTGRGQKLEVA